MKRALWIRILAVVLAVNMMAVPVSAAGHKNKPVAIEPVETKLVETKPGKEKPGKEKPGENKPGENDSDSVLTAVENASNAENGGLLRASTFALTRESTGEQTIVKYFPVTVFNYDDRINVATAELDPGTGDMEGLYFSNGNPVAKTVMNIGEMPAGRYYIQNIRASENRTDGACWLQAHADNKIHAVTQANASIWTLEVENGSYYLKTQINGVDHYMVVGTNGDNDGYTTTKTPITISVFSPNTQGVQLSQNGYYLCQWGGDNVLDFGGYNVENDGGNGMRFYAVDADGNVNSNPTTLAKADAHENLTWAQVQNGTYYADEACTQLVTVAPIIQGTEGYSQVSVTGDAMWAASGGTNEYTWYETPYYYLNNDNYYVLSIQLSGGWYQIGYHNGYYYQTNGTGLGWRQPAEIMSFYEKAGTTVGYTLTAGGQTLATLNGTDTSVEVGVTLYTPGTIETITRAYADWNFWNKGTDNNSNGDLIWTGLVQDTLVDDQIVFTVPEAGIFNNDTSVKDIYEYVGLPFVLDPTTGVYSFDSDVNGVYFEGTPQSGTAEAPYNLHFAAKDPQPMPNGLSVGDGSTNAFLPFNNQDSYATSEVDYHFGMRADLPFSMTPNGRVKSTDDESDPITFTFSGDDDVWVFVDGHLVIDLGGIHNRLDVTIDFAANTITYSEENAQDGDNTTGSFNNPDFAMTQQLFTANGVEGVIPMSREAFALDTEHEMQVFYLERGEGTSNCHIEFNLPMTDTVLVTKDATKSWSQAGEDADLAVNPNDEDPGVDPLTATEQAIINNIDFGFTLYKKTAESEEFEPVASTNFYLIGRGVEGVVIHQTDANGHFYLKNGQSAKFITELPMEGVTYYVVEDKVPDGFVAPDFNFAGAATYEYTYTDGDTTGTAPAGDASQIPEQIIPMPENGVWAQNKSYEVTVKGSIESNDSIEFICSNYMDATLPNPSVFAMEDIIVIDYGLPVRIDPLANDLFRGDTLEILYVGSSDVTLTTSTDDHGYVTGTYTEDDTFEFGSVELIKGTATTTDDVRDTLVYTLNQQLTEVEVLTYVVKVTGNEVNVGGSTMTQNAFAIGKVYIVPATTMYYEENFTSLVTFKNGKGLWDANATTDASAVSAYQEPGVVGTIGDSPYGSDVAYLHDGGDSNGTSIHGDTTNGAIQFSYTFTGTGTSIFARTSATTGYMQVKIYAGADTTGEMIGLTYRDTYYEDTNNSGEDRTGILYNIPVYTNEDLDYGTYTVVATIAKAGTKGAGAVGDDGYQHAGKDFYLDGIRIIQPLNENNETIINAETQETITDKALGAYATDGEDNVDIVTLRQKIITDAETEGNWNFVVLTDTNGEIMTAEEYTSIGPKEEVYLMPGQSVSFSIKYWHRDGYLLHLGMKAPFGTAGVQIGQNTFNLENATDCYYNITGMQVSVVTETDEDGYTYYVATYTITATDRIVALTNLKVTGYYEFILNENFDVEVDGSEGGDQTPDDGTGDEADENLE